jgi:adenosylcobinamide-GDP ribazoletransferase
MAAPRQFTLILVATQFLTRLPVPALTRFQPAWLTQSARYFPLVGVLVGLINAAVWWLAHRVFPMGVAVGLMMAASLLVTGAFHEDGFADTCDGFGGGTTRERVLAIMKDSRLGAYGAIGICMMLGLKWAVLTALPAAALPAIVVASHMVSRWCCMGLIWGLAYVRDEAGGRAKPLADQLSGRDWALGGAIGILACVLGVIGGVATPAGVLPGAALPGAALPGAALPYAVTVATAVAAATVVAGFISLLAAMYFKTRIGGYTGDCLGASQQLAELGFLLAALAVLGAG